MVHILLVRFTLKICVFDLDDIIINLFEHLKHVRDVLCVLQDAVITLKLKQCWFFADKMKYLGQIISSGRLLVDEVRG